MTGRHRETGTTVDMVPRALRGGTKTTAIAIRERYVPRPAALNETGKLEWVYRPGVRHGAHDGTPTIAELATEPCEKRTIPSGKTCADDPWLNVTSEFYDLGYCLPCRIRAALERERRSPRPFEDAIRQAQYHLTGQWVL